MRKKDAEKGDVFSRRGAGFRTETSPRTARLLCCSEWRPATRWPTDRCTTAARWGSWRCQSRWCPAGRGQCPGSRCPDGPNTPPPPHTEDGKREGEVTLVKHWDQSSIPRSLGSFGIQKNSTSHKDHSWVKVFLFCFALSSGWCYLCSLKHKRGDGSPSTTPMSLNVSVWLFCQSFSSNQAALSQSERHFG